MIGRVPAQNGRINKFTMILAPEQVSDWFGPRLQSLRICNDMRSLYLGVMHVHRQLSLCCFVCDLDYWTKKFGANKISRVIANQILPFIIAAGAIQTRVYTIQISGL